MIPVTKPFLPPYEEYAHYLKGIWERNWLTNNGPLVNELELKLKAYLNLDHLLYVTNGTIALQIAIKALGLKGEIITTPFSYVATTSSIVWEGCVPVFVDIDRETFNIDPEKIEQAITNKTSAILATHVYGNPCDIEAIDFIAKKYHLKVIYDGAHAFGVKYKGKSIFSYGDISTASFHATKLFHTIEGGAVMTADPELNKVMMLMRNFGHDGQEKFSGIGINGKNSEMHAAMGLTNLLHIDKIIEQRSSQSRLYDLKISNISLTKQKIREITDYNFSYYAVLLESEEILIKCEKELLNNNIFARRYFYPLLSNLNYVQSVNVPEAEGISKRILCLPLFHDLKEEEIVMIARILHFQENIK